MNPELQTKIADWLENAAQKIGEFTSNEIPPFIHEYLNWKFFEAGFDLMTKMIFVAIGLFIIVKWKSLFNWAKKYENKSEGFSWVGFVMPLVGATALILFSSPLQEIKDMVQIKVAPKVYLLERASEIVKGK